MAAHKRIISTALRQRNEAVKKAQDARNALAKARFDLVEGQRAYRHIERLAEFWQVKAQRYLLALILGALIAALAAGVAVAVLG